MKLKREGDIPIVRPEQKAGKAPRQTQLLGKFASENIRYFWIILALCLISLFSILSAWSSSRRADNNIKVAWVKLMPNGTWDVEFHDETRQPEFFQATIDYILTQWVERRYSEIAHSVKADFGFVYLFMSPRLQNEFTSPNGFNAAAKAAEIADCASCREIKATVRNIDHYDTDKTKFGQHKGTLYRTNVFIQKSAYNGDGSPATTPEKMIVSLQWRIKAKEEIQAQKEILKQNPIGLEIMAYELLKDIS